VKGKELIKLEHLSILEINGNGSFELLQGQITSDMEKVSLDNCVVGSICDVKGRVVSSFITYKNAKENNSFFLVGETEALVATKTVLEKYQPFYDCSLRLRKDIKFYAIEEGCLIRDFPESNLDISSQNYDSFFRLHYLEKKYHLIAFIESKEFKGYNISDNKLSWELDEIINQNFEITSKVINKFTPHELGYHLNTRIDFEKGCYTGQEIVARMHYRAKKLPEIIIRSTNREVKDLMKVYDKDNKAVGLILSCTKTDNNYQCLLSMNKNYSGQDIDF
jgi:folate-binding protein YgfZ